MENDLAGENLEKFKDFVKIMSLKNIDYVFHCDADEFLFFNNNFKNNIKKKAIKFYEPFDELRINWLLFGHNKKKVNKTNSLIKEFTECGEFMQNP